MSREENVIKYYVLCNKLKDVIRTGWKVWNVERERLESQKKDILKKLENEQDGETKKELSKELSNIIIALAKIK